LETEESIVLVLTYKKTDRVLTEKIVERLSNSLSVENGKVEVIYRGSDKKIIVALKNILDLAK
jgi:hypothetical protein